MFLQLSVLAIIIYFTWKYFNSDESAKKLPPGPLGVPILGHLPFLGSSPHKKLLQWKEIYGPILYVRLGSFKTVILTDTKLIKEAFSLTGFAGRSQIQPLIDASEGKGISWTESRINTEQRQFVMRNLRDFGYGRKTVEQKICDEVSTLLEAFRKKIKENEKVKIHGIFTASVVNAFWSIVIGESFSHEDKQIKYVSYLVSERISRSDTPLSKLAMFVPWLTKIGPEFTGYNDKKGAFIEVYDYAQERIDERKKTWVKDQPRDLTDAYLDKVADTTDRTSSFHADEKSQAKSTGDLLMAAVETQSISLEWFITYMSRNPDVQKKLQKEIDEVIGTERLPSLNDRVQMPYAEIVVLELIRMATIVPLGVFHRTLSDVVFHGYTIPKGYTVISNIYGCHHDKSIWSDPENFRPERFLGPDGNKNRTHDQLIGFSSGKRACLGEGLAKDQIFLFATSLLQNFNFAAPTGAPPPKEFFGLTLQPYPFDAIVTERRDK